MTFYDYMRKTAGENGTAKKNRLIYGGILATGLGTGGGYALTKRLYAGKSPKSYGAMVMPFLGAFIAGQAVKGIYTELNKKHFRRDANAMQLRPENQALGTAISIPSVYLGYKGTGRIADAIIKGIRRYKRKKDVIRQAGEIVGGLGKKLGSDSSFQHRALAKLAQGYDDYYPQSTPQSYVDEANVANLQKQLARRYRNDLIKARMKTTAIGVGTGAGFGLLYGKYRAAAGKVLKHKKGVVGGLALLGGIGANQIFSAGQSLLKKYMGEE